MHSLPEYISFQTINIEAERSFYLYTHYHGLLYTYFLVDMQLLASLILQVCGVTCVSALVCYSGLPGSPASINTVDTATMGGTCNNDTCACVSYKFVCSNNDQLCTTQEQEVEAQKWRLTVVGNTTCQQMAATPTTYMNVTCCYTDHCNKQGYSAVGSVKPTFYLYVIIIALFLFCK